MALTVVNDNNSALTFFDEIVKTVAVDSWPNDDKSCTKEEMLLNLMSAATDELWKYMMEKN